MTRAAEKEGGAPCNAVSCSRSEAPRRSEHHFSIAIAKIRAVCTVGVSRNAL